MVDPLCAATISFAGAQRLLAEDAAPLGVEEVPLVKAGRRMLAQDVVARIDSPRSDVAAMDGYAIAAGVETDEFEVVGASYPADPFVSPIGLVEAVLIMTGAMVPPGAGRVVPVEKTQAVPGAARVRIVGATPAKSHIRIAGSDFRSGDVLLRAGQIIDARRMVVAAGGDCATLTVQRRPRVKVLTIGDELVQPGAATADRHAVPDSLSAALLQLCRQWGTETVRPERFGDDPVPIEEAVREAIGGLDVLIIAGGASHGVRDYARGSLAQLGLEVVFAGVEMKPGKPVWYGRIGHCHVMGLPGNPTAALTTARLFLAPLLAVLGGREFASALVWSNAPSRHTAAAVDGRDHFLSARWDGREVEILARQDASSQSSLADANALVWRPARDPTRAAGSQVVMLRF